MSRHAAGLSGEALLGLLRELVWREVQDRYRGSVLGIVWALLLPLAMLAVYTFVFGFVFRARWGGGGDDPYSFALFIYCGLVPFLFVSDVLSRSPGLLIQHASLVKRVAFPLPLLAVASTLAAAVHLLIGLSVLIAASWLLAGFKAGALLALPLMVPLILAGLGLVWLFSAAAVFFRDLGQAIPALLPLLLFLSPVFYPVSAVPAGFRVWMQANPLTAVIDALRAVVLGAGPVDTTGLVVAMLMGTALALVGWIVFARLQPGFADTL
ncbi:MAG: ABC transporter permease [Burkholderiales bacterium]|jgi:lipopolysaccharide transport system permease protein|nr:ABC transporter permease [Burkholderiales bacterium]